MKADARAVVDTNGLISSALLAASVPARLVMHILRHGRLLFSEDTFTELEQRLWRPKFDRSPQRFSRDPDDDKFRHAAVAGRADVLISGDGHLLELHGCGVTGAGSSLVFCALVAATCQQTPSCEWAAYSL